MHEPFVVKLVLSEAAAAGPIASARASFNRAHDSRAAPNADEAEERVARAIRYDLAVAMRSEYACWDCSRSAFVRTACGGRGGGGRGRLYWESGFVVDAREYVGDPGTGGSCEGVGEGGRS